MHENTPITYEAVRRMDRPDSLTLGVSGRDAAADAQRLEVAQNLAAERGQILDEAYQSAHWMREPSIPEPFGLSAIIEAGGNVQAVVDGPDFDHLVLEDLGLGASEAVVSDEDGIRYEWIEPSDYDWETARNEAARIRLDLAARGDIDADSQRTRSPALAQAFQPLHQVDPERGVDLEKANPQAPQARHRSQ